MKNNYRGCWGRIAYKVTRRREGLKIVSCVAEVSIQKVGNKYVYENDYTKYDVHTGNEITSIAYHVSSIHPTRERAEYIMKREILIDELKLFVSIAGRKAIECLSNPMLEAMLDTFRRGAEAAEKEKS